MLELLKTVAWPGLVLAFFVAYREPLRRLVDAVVGRVEAGDEVKISTWLTLGHSTGPLKLPASADLITDDHLALIHRSWRVPERDAEFGGVPMHQVHLIVFGEAAALDRVDYVIYRLDPAYPNPVRYGGDRQGKFELKELANGYSLVRAEVKVKGQPEIVHLSRFIDLVDQSPPLKGTYL